MEPAAETAQPQTPTPAGYLQRISRFLKVLLLVLIVYLVFAYLVLPALWRHYEHHPVMAEAPKTTFTKEGFAGDPLNVALVGTREETVRALIAAGWQPADPTTFRSGLGIAKDVLMGHPYPTAPMSNLYLFGRRQDLAFEQPLGNNPRRRHHVRFWSAPEFGQGGRPLWLGAATFDRSVGFSHRTGQITHHISPNIDAERDKLIADLTQAGQLIDIYQVTGAGLTINGRNGGGDRYVTDGELTVGVLAPQNVVQTTQPATRSNPPAVAVKNETWRWLRDTLFSPEGATENSAEHKPEQHDER